MGMGYCFHSVFSDPLGVVEIVVSGFALPDLRNISTDTARYFFFAFASALPIFSLTLGTDRDVVVDVAS